MGATDTEFHAAFTRARVAGEERYLGTVARLAGDPDRSYAAQINEPWSDESISARIRRFMFEVRMAPLVLMQWVASTLLWVISWMIYAQYVWGFFTLTVLTMLGPLFIPFMMVTQLDFLFWGWLKAMLTGVIYMLTAAALYAATAMLMIAPLDRIAEVLIPDDSGSLLGSMELVFRLGVEYVPLVIMCLFAALKVNAVSGMIMAGGTPPGSGIGSFITKAESLGGTLAGRYGLPSGSRGAAPLSQTTGGGPTPQQRARRAFQEGRRRAGAPPRPTTGGPAGGSRGSGR